MSRSRKNDVTLVFGGARSGKSSFAGAMAERRFRKPLYLATAQALDREMKRRIALHKKARGSNWKLAEEPLDIAKIITNPPAACDGILLDCLTLWLSNVLIKEGDKGVAVRKRQLLRSLGRAGCPVVIVSNEVGMGIVPESELGRRFRDHAGWLNQAVASASDAVVLVAAGLPMVLKGDIEMFDAGRPAGRRK